MTPTVNVKSGFIISGFIYRAHNVK